MKDEKYLNFPINMVQGAFTDIKALMSDIMDYAGYVHTMKLSGDKIARMKAAGKFFGISYGLESLSYSTGKTLFEQYQKTPMVGISHTMLFDFYTNNKTQDEIAVLVAYLAIKSILGTKAYNLITNDYLIARMGGYSKVSDLPDPLPDPLNEFSTRRKLDKIKMQLRAGWNVHIYGYRMRGFYVAIGEAIDYEKLVLEAEKRRKTNIEKRLKQQQHDARIKALHQLQ